MPPWHEQHAGADGSLVEPCGDLVGALAPDPEVAELELGMEQSCPVLPLAFGVPDALARVPVRGALGDRVPEAGDDRHRGSVIAPAR